MQRAFVVLFGLCVFFAAVTNAAEKDDPVARAAAGNNEFAADLYMQVRGEEGNIFFSPYSIRTALAMAYAGARGNTTAQMRDVMALGVPDEDLHGTLARLRQKMAASARTESDFQFSVANALWGQEGLDFKQDFLKMLEQAHGAGLRRVDYIKDSEAARVAINDWVREATKDKIKDLVPKRGLTRDTRLVLANAVYFKGTWVETFSEGATKEEDFHVTPEKTAKVQMMHQTARFPYAESENWQMVELPYRGGFGMVVVLPKERGGLSDMEAKLGEVLQAGLFGEKPTRAQRVKLSLPKFKFSARMGLADTLKKMGMKDAFIGDADFSGMTDEAQLYIQKVLHKAFIDLDEEGTEAAAATGMAMGATSAPIGPPIPFRADHPFFFAIRDRSTGTIVFMGRLAEAGERKRAKASENTFAPGQVVVSLKPTDPPSKAIKAFSEKYQLKWMGGKPRIAFRPVFTAYFAPKDVTKKVTVEEIGLKQEDIRKKAIRLFGEERLINVGAVFRAKYGCTVITVLFGPGSKQPDAVKLAGSLDSLVLKESVDGRNPDAGTIMSITGVVLVGEGDEQEWVDRFNKDASSTNSIIKSAQLNSLLKSHKLRTPLQANP
jgi:serpin B